MSMRAIGEPVGPLPCHRLVEALDLAVGAGAVGLGRQVLDAASGEQLAQGAVLDVGEGVVRQEPLGRDAVALEEDERPLEEGGDGGGPLVGVELEEFVDLSRLRGRD